MPRRPPRPPPYTDLHPKRWRDRPDVLTDSLWLFPSRATGRGHTLSYHGNFVPQIATQLITRFTRPGDVVLDLFLGAGTTAIEARALGRKCVGVDIQPRLVRLVRERLGGESDHTRLIAGDSAAPKTHRLVRAALRELGAASAGLLILHPPYRDIIRFSDLPGDLSAESDTRRFLARFTRIARAGLRLLAPGRFLGLVIGDMYEHRQVVPLGFLCMNALLRLGPGPALKAVIVKDIQGNERGKGKSGPLWRYRALLGGFYIFKHEYVMLFQKPAAKAGRS
ncbi:MAG: DNA methylase [Planctomycetes bacterium]|nr:DNA methylase [Planctomycetota bacterium]